MYDGRTAVWWCQKHLMLSKAAIRVASQSLLWWWLRLLVWYQVIVAKVVPEGWIFHFPFTTATRCQSIFSLGILTVLTWYLRTYRVCLLLPIKVPRSYLAYFTKVDLRKGLLGTPFASVPALLPSTRKGHVDLRACLPANVPCSVERLPWTIRESVVLDPATAPPTKVVTKSRYKKHEREAEADSRLVKWHQTMEYMIAV